MEELSLCKTVDLILMIGVEWETLLMRLTPKDWVSLFPQRIMSSYLTKWSDNPFKELSNRFKMLLICSSLLLIAQWLSSPQNYLFLDFWQQDLVKSWKIAVSPIKWNSNCLLWVETLSWCELKTSLTSSTLKVKSSIKV